MQEACGGHTAEGGPLTRRTVQIRVAGICRVFASPACHPDARLAVSCCPAQHCAPFAGLQCCVPGKEPGQYGNADCPMNHTCCPTSGEWVCSNGDGTFNCPGAPGGGGDPCATGVWLPEGPVVRRAMLITCILTPRQCAIPCLAAKARLLLYARWDGDNRCVVTTVPLGHDSECQDLRHCGPPSAATNTGISAHMRPASLTSASSKSVLRARGRCAEPTANSLLIAKRS